MDDYFPIIMTLVYSTIILTVVLVGRYLAGERRRSLKEFSDRMHFTFYPGKSALLPGNYWDFELLSLGDSQQEYNIMVGDLEGFRLIMFDFKYETGVGRFRRAHHVSFAALNKNMDSPRLLIRPQSLLDGVKSKLVSKDIDFESDEFNRTYYVESKDKKFAYDVIYQKMMEFLLEKRGWGSGWRIEMLGPTIMVGNGSMLSPDEFIDAMSFLQGFVRLFPEYLKQALNNKTR